MKERHVANEISGLQRHSLQLNDAFVSRGQSRPLYSISHLSYRSLEPFLHISTRQSSNTKLKGQQSAPLCNKTRAFLLQPNGCPRISAFISMSSKIFDVPEGTSVSCQSHLVHLHLLIKWPLCYRVSFGSPATQYSGSYSSLSQWRQDYGP